MSENHIGEEPIAMMNKALEMSIYSEMEELVKKDSMPLHSSSKRVYDV
jgi:hypothetical protein